jgi:YD repeat-containing protein
MFSNEFVENSHRSSSTVASVSTSTTVIPPTTEISAVSNEVAIAPSSSSPYVDSLMAEIMSMRQRYLTEQSQQVIAPQPTIVAAAPSDSSAALSNSSVDLGAVQSVESTEVQPQITEAVPQVVAVAPLGSESYAPLLESVTGQMVNPELPPLPGVDAFLPNGSVAFDGYIWPARGVLTSGYGWRWGRMHRGIDIAAPIGTPAYASAAGVVVRAGWNSGGFGNLVEVRHPDGSLTRYAHLSRIHVTAGQEVSQGEHIADIGSTGRSTGPHLHFEVHLPNQGSVNPIAYLP